MNDSLNIGPPLQDPLTMATRRLGEAKSDAAKRGMGMIDSFDKIKKEIDTLKEYGLSITSVEFDNPAIQAAWRQYSTGDWYAEIPLMATENTIVSRIRDRDSVNNPGG